jgi:hypothetical protein
MHDDHSLYCLGTSTSIKTSGFKLVLCAETHQVVASIEPVWPRYLFFIEVSVPSCTKLEYNVVLAVKLLLATT